MLFLKEYAFEDLTETEKVAIMPEVYDYVQEKKVKPHQQEFIAQIELKNKADMCAYKLKSAGSSESEITLVKEAYDRLTPVTSDDFTSH